jgi:peptidylprolyl isomerase
MKQAKTGDMVTVNYTGRLDDGEVFDSSEGRSPLEFQIGQGQIISGFEEAVQGMAEGEKKTVRIESEQAYGPYVSEMVQTIDRESVPAAIDLELGTRLKATGPDDQTIVLTVIELTEESVTLDANHPLAGKALTFEIELLAIA